MKNSKASQAAKERWARERAKKKDNHKPKFLWLVITLFLILGLMIIFTLIDQPVQPIVPINQTTIQQNNISFLCKYAVTSENSLRLNCQVIQNGTK